ncbi:DUF4329 domain-containing protein [Pseudomonas cichorii]|uniref:DUF4329 domain-containing protein n=1 Tax=Pseudomonas cichorii TaxID=36746 RepID=UPI001C8AFF4E|nr:DUF4329 domain-containing protein [Pseudomonas cichorii]MBX8483742.1 DUF4329 domain-containing protein [Pseudomonas cichorii]MBX8566074.1 DUF4329 domain-containing protein [Pseudomonas cichorii]MBX8568216.1 DUF4329 domain-containing protein [Pseudomonas cichorii]
MQPRLRRTRRSIASHPRMPALSEPFDHPDDVARYVHEVIGNRRDREYGGFILVRGDGKYVATEPMAGKTFEFDPNEVFPSHEQEGYVYYPAGHADYAIYHSHPAFFAGLDVWSEREKATYPNSLSVADIHAVIDDHEVCSVTYLSGPDGSLIKYTLSHSEAEQALFRRVSGPADRPHQCVLSDVHRGLQAQTLMPSDLVRMLAHAGDLHVVVTSRLWGKPGKVADDWQPYPPMPAPAVCETVWPVTPLLLSPEFPSADEAARYAHGRIGPRAHSQAIGFLLIDPQRGVYRAAAPRLEDGSMVYAPCSAFHPDAYYRPPLPEGYRIDGMYFSPDTVIAEGERPERRNFFQPDDLHRMFEYRYIPPRRSKWVPVRYGFTMSEVYFSSPDGALLGYTPSHSALEYQLLRQLSRVYSGSESIQAQLAAGTLGWTDFVRRVAQAGRLRVINRSQNWPTAGVVVPPVSQAGN